MRVSNHKRVLVAGGAGFLGSHLCERLLNDGCDTLCLDDHEEGLDTTIDYSQKTLSL